MNYCFTNVSLGTVSGPEYHDVIYVKDGVWVKTVLDDCTIIDCSDLVLYPQLTEIHADFKQPGHDHIYSLVDGVEAMQRGGYNKVLLDPNCNPIVDERAWVEWVKAQTQTLDGDILISSAISKGLANCILTEYLEMEKVGATALSNSLQYTPESSFLKSVFSYSTQSSLRIHIMPQEKDLAGNALIHEGELSDRYGLYGVPLEAETIAVFRILELAKSTGAKIHLKHLTVPKSIELVQEYKNIDVDVTCDVSINNLVFSEADLEGLPPKLHLKPILRNKANAIIVKQLVEAGTVDAISCQHIPVLPEDKNSFFEGSESGCVGLEVGFSVAKTFLNLNDEKLIALMSDGPNKILGQAKVVLAPGQKFLTFAYHTHEFIPHTDDFAGLVSNSPFLGEKLAGKIVGLLSKGHWKNFRSH